MYTRNTPAGDVKQFIDWVLSDEGQAIVSLVGYFPVK
jgi:ABC-type phosphate transport system substrate-binding protein